MIQLIRKRGEKRMMKKEAMLLCAVTANAFCLLLLICKNYGIEKGKKDTPCDLLYQMVYPLIGISIGTILAYFN